MLVLEPGLEECQGDDGQCSGQFHYYSIRCSDGTISGYGGAKTTDPERLAQARQPKHVAVSLMGEPNPIHTSLNGICTTDSSFKMSKD